MKYGGKLFMADWGQNVLDNLLGYCSTQRVND